MTIIIVIIYLAAIAVANLTAAAFGPNATIINAFALIALDLTTRDILHDRWHGRGLWPRMLSLIIAGGVIAWAVNPAAGRIAVASCVAFTAAALVDAGVYQLLERRPRLVRANGSNIPAALVDSIIFPTIAFGGLLPLVTLGQFAAKVLGGLLWSLILFRLLKRGVSDAVSVRRVGG